MSFNSYRGTVVRYRIYTMCEGKEGGKLAISWFHICSSDHNSRLVYSALEEGRERERGGETRWRKKLPSRDHCGSINIWWMTERPNVRPSVHIIEIHIPRQSTIWSYSCWERSITALAIRETKQKAPSMPTHTRRGGKKQEQTKTN